MQVGAIDDPEHIGHPEPPMMDGTVAVLAPRVGCGPAALLRPLRFSCVGTQEHGTRQTPVGAPVVEGNVFRATVGPKNIVGPAAKLGGKMAMTTNQEHCKRWALVFCCCICASCEL